MVRLDRQLDGWHMMLQMLKIFSVCLCSSILVCGGWSNPALAQADPTVWRQQVIYLLLMDRFENGDLGNDQLAEEECVYPNPERMFHGGDFVGLQQRIDYLQELGVTAVWSTPVYEQVTDVVATRGCPYHGYWPNLTIPYTGQLEPRFGTEAEFSALLQDLEAHNIRYIMDMVVNHSGYGADLLTLRPNWFRPGSNECQRLESGQIACGLTLPDLLTPTIGPDLRRPCLDQGPELIYCPLFGLPDLIQEDPEVSQYLTDMAQLLIRKYLMHGIRVDTVRHIEVDYFTDTWIPAVQEAKPDLFLVGEALYDHPEVPAQILTPYLQAGFDSMFNFPLRSALEETFARDGSVSLVASKMREGIAEYGLDRALMMTNLLDNHDMSRFVSIIENHVGFAEQPGHAEAIRQRYHLALALLFTLPGIPQLYYGNEITMMGEGDPLTRRDMPDWAWSAEGRVQNPTAGKFLPQAEITFTYVQRLIQLRQQNPALFNGYYAELFRQWDPAASNVYAFFRGDGDNRILTIVNNSLQPTGSLFIPIQGVSDLKPADRQALADGAEWIELLEAGAPARVHVSRGEIQINLPAKTVGIYQHQTVGS